MYKRFFYFIIICVLSFGLVGCNNSNAPTMKGESYTINQSYNSVITVSLSRQGNKITDINVDEVMDIFSFSNLDRIVSKIDESDIMVIKNNRYVKNVKVGDVIFSLNEDKYIVKGGEEFSMWLKNGENAKYYATHLSKGDYYLLKENGEKYDAKFKEEKNVLPFKNKTNLYWQESNSSLGYKKNIKLMCDYVKRYGLEGITKGDTGATIAAFDLYLSSIKSAYDNAR